MAFGLPASSIVYPEDGALPTSLPASASYNYLVPALYLNLTVKAVLDLGELATGGEQLLGPILDGHLYSEPGFEPQFSGAIRYAADYLTSDPDGEYARPSCVMTVVPDNHAGLPFLMRITGIQKANKKLDIIFNGSTSGLAVPYGYSYSIWTPFFSGGSANFSNLQDSVFVGSETASSSPIAGAFTVGMKFSKVFVGIPLNPDPESYQYQPVNTSITIGNEYP
ncbi:hypothetical protein LTR97_003573 [Elasticomyces elasticus]|uniref:Uncharacterized protein n=1 Tax=Elasticomyces elasticus TaxID=574655 RepID=A0AAN7WCQ6_9PEZI|nr:hypothetical protein LTR97_003573 [Elasticomyces elasticus]